MAVAADSFLKFRMTELTEKEELLESSGYTYHFERVVYFSRAARQAFSLEFVEDHSRERIKELMDRTPVSKDWVFHFNQLPSERIQRDLAEEFEK